jgi:CheY-like chemotaxis protein
LGLISPQIAVVDDDEDTLNLFTDIVQTNGYIVIGFENPQFLIDYICEHPEHLKFIVIDYRMPKMTGCKLAIRIHKITPSIQMALLLPIMILSITSSTRSYKKTYTNQ